MGKECIHFFGPLCICSWYSYFRASWYMKMTNKMEMCRGWVGPRARLDRCGKCRLHRDSIPYRPAHSQSLYQLSYPAHCIYIYINIIIRMERIKNEHIKEIMGVKEKPDIIDRIERKRLQWYGHVERVQDERLPKLIMEWIPKERRKRGSPRKTWMEGVRAAMKTRHLEADQWLNRKEKCLGSGRRLQLSQDWKDR